MKLQVFFFASFIFLLPTASTAQICSSIKLGPSFEKPRWYWIEVKVSEECAKRQKEAYYRVRIKARRPFFSRIPLSGKPEKRYVILPTDDGSVVFKTDNGDPIRPGYGHHAGQILLPPNMVGRRIRIIVEVIGPSIKYQRAFKILVS